MSAQFSRNIHHKRRSLSKSLLEWKRQKKRRKEEEKRNGKSKGKNGERLERLLCFTTSRNSFLLWKLRFFFEVAKNEQLQINYRPYFTKKKSRRISFGSDTPEKPCFSLSWMSHEYGVVVWLKIRKNDIKKVIKKFCRMVVVWLKIRKNDIWYVYI